MSQQRSIEFLPHDTLSQILQPFQNNEESLFISLVCKQWQSIIQRNKISRKKVVLHYAANGTTSSLVFLRSIINDDKAFFITSFFCVAQPQTLAWSFEIIKDLPQFHTKAIYGYVRGGHLKYLKLIGLSVEKCPNFKKLWFKAIEGESIQVLNWIEQNNMWTDQPYLLNNFLNSAAKKGNLKLFQWISDQLDSPQDTRYCLIAAEKGNIKILEHIKEIGWKWDERTCSAAAAAGQLETVRYLLENGCKDSKVCVCAAENGHLEILKLARKYDCEWNFAVCDFAARAGQLEVLKWAKQNGCDCTNYVCSFAAEYGHFEVLKWAREQGCSWNSSTSRCAIQSGKLEVVKWLYENGCKFPQDSCEVAAEWGRREIFDWLVKNIFTDVNAGEYASCFS